MEPVVLKSVIGELRRWRSSEAAIAASREGLARFRGAPDGAAARKNLSPLAPTHLTLVCIAAAVVLAASIGWGRDGHGWATTGLLLGMASLAQLFIVEKPGWQSYRLAIVFLVAGALMLTPTQICVLAALHYVASWFRFVRSWHVRIFNVCCTLLSSSAAWFVYGNVTGAGHLRMTFAATAAAGMFVLVNHVLLAVMIRLAAGIRLRETKLFSTESLSTDLVLALLGVGVTVVWRANPWTVAFAVAPLLLVHRALHVPQLEIDARIDAKTGLLNAREFDAALSHEFARASRSAAVLSVLMLDLDHLREINNTYGHLAGDAVLRATARTVQDELRHGDVAARFGGEEFAVLIPGVDHEGAMLVAERIRAAIELCHVDDDSTDAPLHATVSIGVATYPDHGRTPKELVHMADTALYRAKEGGRNRAEGVGVAPTPSRLVALSA